MLSRELNPAARTRPILRCSNPAVSHSKMSPLESWSMSAPLNAVSVENWNFRLATDLTDSTDSNPLNPLNPWLKILYGRSQTVKSSRQRRCLNTDSQPKAIRHVEKAAGNHVGI